MVETTPAPPAPPVAPGRSFLTIAAQTTGASVLQVGLVVITTSILSRTLGAVGKGMYDLCIAATQLAYAIISLSFPSAVTYLVASGRVDPVRILRLSYPWAAIQALVTFGALQLLLRHGLASVAIPPEMGQAGVAMVSVTVGALSLAGWSRAATVGLRRFLRANSGDVFRQCFGIGLIVILIVISRGQITRDRVLLFLAANAAAALFANWLYGRGIRPQAPVNPAWRAGATAAYCVPAFCGDLCQFLNYRLGVFFVNGWAGLAAVGHLQSATFVAQALWLLPQSLAAILFPLTANAAGRDEDSAPLNARCTRIVLLISTICAALMAVSASFLIPLLFGPTFQPAVPVFLVLAPGAVAFCSAKVLAGYIAGIGKPRWNFYGALTGLLVTAGLMALLVPTLGALGAAIATTASNTCNAAVLVGAFVRHTRIPLAQVLIPTPQDLTSMIRYASRLGRAVASYA